MPNHRDSIGLKQIMYMKVLSNPQCSNKYQKLELKNYYIYKLIWATLVAQTVKNLLWMVTAVMKLKDIRSLEEKLQET